jgi:GNAT superfamily N-acetyltransferase
MPPEASPLFWRIEHACFAAWPALREMQVDGWLLRAANGLSRRANSANPLASASGNLDAVLAACEKFYYAQNLSVILRLPSFVDPSIQDRALQRQYRSEGETLVMHTQIESARAEANTSVDISNTPTDDWFRSMSRLQNYTPEKYDSYRRVVGLIAVPAGYALLRHEGRPVSASYGAIHDGMLVFESVVTDKDHRGKGHGKRMLAALLAWGRAAGATGVCLQVQADNTAVALYTSLGLRPLYRYRYLREPERSGA